MGDIESVFDVQQAVEALAQKARAGQQHHRDDQFHYHQICAQALPQPAGRGAPAFRKPGMQILEPRTQRGRCAHQQSRQQRDRGGSGAGVRIQTDVVDKRQVRDHALRHQSAKQPHHP